MLVAVLLVGHTHRPLARRAHQHYVADGDRAFLLRNAALDVALGIGAHVLHHHHVLHQNLPGGRHDAQYAAFLALIAPANDPDLVVTSNVYNLVHVCSTCLAVSHQLSALTFYLVRHSPFALR